MAVFVCMQIQRVVFTGNFLRKNEIAQQTVSYSLAKWSELARGGSRMEALFLKHEGYFGAMGAFLANRTNAAGTYDCVLRLVSLPVTNGSFALCYRRICGCGRHAVVGSITNSSATRENSPIF